MTVLSLHGNPHTWEDGFYFETGPWVKILYKYVTETTSIYSNWPLDKEQMQLMFQLKFEGLHL